MSTTRTAASARDTANPSRERAFDRALELGKPDASEHRRSRASVRPSRRHPSVLRLLIGADLLGFATAFLLAQQVVGPPGQSDQALGPKGALLFLAMLPVWSLIASANGLYSREEERPDHTLVDDLGSILTTVTIGTWVFLSAGWLVLGPGVDVEGPLALWAAALVSVVLWRLLARILIRRRVDFVQNVVIVGAGDVGQMVADKLIHHGKRVNVVGFVDDQPKPLREGLGHIALLGSPERLPALIDLLDVDRVMIAFSRSDHATMVALIRALKDFDVRIDIVPRLFEGFGTRVGMHVVDGLPLVGLPPLRLSRTALALKRTMDTVLSLAGLVVLGPVFAVIALLIKRDSRGPILYRHERIGRDRRPIGVYKFRTMRLEYCRGEGYGGDAAEEAFTRLMADPARRSEFEHNYKLADDPRVTRVGAVLRRTSLDELPQLFNVLRGDISLVGPRPITREELSRYGADADALLNLRPGLTGYWQISGRSVTSYSERVRLDMAYVTSWSLSTDLLILAKSFGKVVLARHGAV